MKNIQKLLLVLGIACIGISPVIAMEKSHLGKHGRDEEQDSSKRPRLTQDAMEEVVEIKPVIKIDWGVIFTMMDDRFDYKGVVEKYGSSFSIENGNFEMLFRMALESNVGFDQRLQPIVDLIEKSGPEVLKLIIRAHIDNDYSKLEERLKKRYKSYQDHILCTLHLHNRKLLDLLLDRVPVDLINEEVVDKRWCQWVLEVIQEDGIVDWLELFLKRGYQVSYYDLSKALDNADFRAFNYLLFYVSSDNFSSVFNSPTGDYDNLLYEILRRGLHLQYVELLLTRDNVPPCNFERMAIAITSYYRLPNGSLNDQGDAILVMIGDYFKIQDYRNEYARIVDPINNRLAYIEKDNVVEIEKFLLKGGSPDEFVHPDCTYVTNALDFGSVGCLNLLLAYGAELDACGTVFNPELYSEYTEPIQKCIEYQCAIRFLNDFGIHKEVEISQLPIEDFLTDHDFHEGLQDGCLEGFYLDIANEPCQTLSYLDGDDEDKMSQIKLMLRYPKVAEKFIFPILYRWFTRDHRKNVLKKVDNQLTVQENVSNEIFIVNELKNNCEKELENNRKNYCLQGQKMLETDASNIYAWYVLGEKLKKRLYNERYSDVVIKTKE